MKKVTRTSMDPYGEVQSKEVTLTESMSTLDFLLKLCVLLILVAVFAGVAQYVWTEEMRRQQYCERADGNPPICR